jgi:hypothetical protein
MFFSFLWFVTVQLTALIEVFELCKAAPQFGKRLIRVRYMRKSHAMHVNPMRIQIPHPTYTDLSFACRQLAV